MYGLEVPGADCWSERGTAPWAKVPSAAARTVYKFVSPSLGTRLTRRISGLLQNESLQFIAKIIVSVGRADAVQMGDKLLSGMISAKE